jgi:hypothetical protein
MHAIRERPVPISPVGNPPALAFECLIVGEALFNNGHLTVKPLLNQ